MSDKDSGATKQLACPHPEAVGKRWGDPISEERQCALQSYLDRWAGETDHGEQTGPFYGVPLTGAAVCGLAEQSGRDALQAVRTLQVERAILRETYLEGAILSGVHLKGTTFSAAKLIRTDRRFAHLAVGLLIEVIFIATGTQRLFGAK